MQRFGKVDVLVNGAAGNFLATAERLSTNAIKKVIDIDTIGTFHMSQQVFKQSFKKQKSGVIINITMTLHWNGAWGLVHAAAAKAGVDSITKVLATEWGPHGVRVNGIAPGAIEGTEGFERLGDLNNLNNKSRTNSAVKRADSGKDENQTALQVMKGLVPVQRFGNVNDIGQAAVFLASPGASYVSGTTLVVDGGNYLTAPNMMFVMPQFVKMYADAKL